MLNSARVIDFKSDQVSDKAGIAPYAAKYEKQLQQYGTVIQGLLNLDPEAIKLELHFTLSGTVHPLGTTK